MFHIIHDVFRSPLDAGRREFYLQPAQIRQSDDTREKMTPDLAIRPVSDWSGSYKIIIIAEPEAILHLPAFTTGLHNLSGRPVGIISDDDILAEHSLLGAYRIGILSEAHSQAIIVLIIFKYKEM